MSATPLRAAQATPKAASAMQAGLLACTSCRLVTRPPPEGGSDRPPRLAGWVLRCPRCDAVLHSRKPDSIRRTWAFLLAAYALYIPANVLPIMNTSSLFNAQRDTILSGVVFLWNNGSAATAALVFFASIVEPLLKLFALTWLVWSAQRGSQWQTRTRARLYRLVKLVGRWSMLDIFVVTLLVALVQIESVAEIRVGPGAFAFGAVVVLTMFAGFAFDPRLLWDPLAPEND